MEFSLWAFFDEIFCKFFIGFDIDIQSAYFWYYLFLSKFVSDLNIIFLNFETNCCTQTTQQN
jgi:hypothetical protein